MNVYRVDDDAKSIHGMFITVDDLGSIQFRDLVDGNGSIYSWFSSVNFSDTTSLILADITSLTTHGGEGNDTIAGAYGTNAIDETVYGYEGDDSLNGGAGNDTLDGGIGNDLLTDDSGNDIYKASPGFDVIMEASGTDVIELPPEITLDDVNFIRIGSSPNDLQITIDGLGQILIVNQFYISGSQVELFELATGTLDLTTRSIETIGSTSNDVLSGITVGASEDDIFDGREGDDTLQGGAGSDVYYFSEGDDVVDESSGTNDGVKFR